MATNFKQPGDEVTIVAAANASSGDVVVLNKLFGVATHDALTGENLTLALGGVYTLTKLNAASTSMAAGANVFWDATNAVATPTNSFQHIGVCITAVSNTATTVWVRLNDCFGAVA